jgi:hypothetical protein
MVLTDPNRGVLTASKLFRDNPSYKLVTEVSKVDIVHVLKVHDYNYLRKVIEQAKSLEFTNPTGIVKLGKIIIKN